MNAQPIWLYNLYNYNNAKSENAVALSNLLYAAMKKRDKLITSKIMSKIPSTGTKPEILLAKEIFKLGLRYRKQYNIDGKPDLVFVKKKIAIFVDGDFWHGNNWRIRGLNSFEEEIARYSIFWKDKIIRNTKRDKKVNKILKKQNWLVLRYWESDIKKSCPKIAKKILKIYQSRQTIMVSTYRDTLQHF